MKIVLIGAGGFLGRAFFKEYSNDNNITEWHLLSSSLPATPASDRCYHHRYSWPQNSVADEVYSKVLINADVIIYAAGAGIQPGEKADDQAILNLNLLEPARLAQQLIKQNFKGQLITFGSYFEIGKHQQHQLLGEEQFLEQYNPLPNLYCRAKKELSHFHFVHTQTGTPYQYQWLHLVLTNIYGPGENENRLIPYIIQQSKMGLPLHFTSGSQVRQYTFIGDVVSVTRSLLGKASGMFHVTNEETVPVKTIIEEAVQQVKSKLSIEPELHFDVAERRDTAMDYLGVSAQKLKRDWNLSCSTSYKEGVSLYFGNESN